MKDVTPCPFCQLTELLKRRPIKLQSIYWCLINLPVPGVDNRPVITPHDQATAVWDRVSDTYRLNPDV